MSAKRWIWGGVGALAVLGLALGSTYVMLDRCSLGRSRGGLDIAKAHRWVHQMNLSSDQEANLAPLEISLQRDLEPLQLQLAEERTALCGYLADDTVDEKQLESAVNRVADLEIQQQRRILRHLREMRSILTPAQRRDFFTSLQRAVCENCGMSAQAGSRCLCERKGRVHGAK